MSNDEMDDVEAQVIPELAEALEKEKPFTALNDHRCIWTVHGESDISWYSMRRSTHSPEQIKEAARRSSGCTFGWFPDFELAEHAVLNNVCDIHEVSYTYMVIEKYEWGVYMMPTEEHWYRWIQTGLGHDQGHYEPIEKPKELERVISFGMS